MTIAFLKIFQIFLSQCVSEHYASAVSLFQVQRTCEKEPLKKEGMVSHCLHLTTLIQYLQGLCFTFR